MEESMLLTYRYFYTVVKDGVEVNMVEYVTAVDSAQSVFMERLRIRSDLVRAGREYVCSYDVAQIGKFETIVSESKVERFKQEEVLN